MTTSTPRRALSDDAERRIAIGAHDRSLLIEAGAGSGKTAVMAGRIAALLAEGVAPKSIAAVTFTELAAGELLGRVRDFVAALSMGQTPAELRVAFPDGLTEEQTRHLVMGAATIDDITCSTIHGFCQRLIKPYPVEADIDPGAKVMDRGQADLAFLEIVETWLRERLSGGEGGIIAEMVLHQPSDTVALIHAVTAKLRERHDLSGPAVVPLAPRLTAFRQAVLALSDFLGASAVVEPETAVIAGLFAQMAADLEADAVIATPAGLVRLLVTRPPDALCTKTGFRAYQKKGKWADEAKRAGLSKADGEQLNAIAQGLYHACRDTWIELARAVAGRALDDLITEVRPALQRYRDHKRSTALLDFDDLILAARNLLRGHDAVRRALATRFSHVLVDEFQDTDPLQAEIFWRLCGDPPTGDPAVDALEFRLRPGALFLVGDPKQAVYRFRGADVGAYVRARAALLAQDAESVLSIATNFRSCGSILNYVNERFEACLSAEGQPGFTKLAIFHDDRPEGLCVAALDVAVADAEGKASAERRRDGEAEAVADVCARLIGGEMILDRRSGSFRPCQPGDIALLAPTGSELWRYEEALERRGIPVASQAGKRFYRRQEVQDLIALTRVLADPRDTLALGALLRGPLVGLTEENLLDLVWALPRSADEPDRLPRLTIAMDAAAIVHPEARAVFEKLQALRRRINSVAPHQLLCEAVDVLRIRPILLARHRGQAERALANVDLYLDLSRAFGVRGLRAFAETMTAAWKDEARAVEGRPDAQEEAVALYTVHAAKGLEWPVVIPINAMTQIVAGDSVFVDRASDTLYAPLFGSAPTGYDDARDSEKLELNRERIRLWYVAATRARELLVLPRLDVAPASNAWIALLDLSLADLPALELSHHSAEVEPVAGAEFNPQTRDGFAAEAAVIADRQTHLTWLTPSRDESAESAVLQRDVVQIWMDDEEAQPPEAIGELDVQGGRERGLVLHKLIEEVLTGETQDDEASLSDRARALIGQLGRPVAENPADGLTPQELASCVRRAFALPEIEALRPSLIPELGVYASRMHEGQEQVTVGIADAISFDASGAPTVVVDWKSDVDPTPQALDHYRAQVSAYLEMTGAERGLIVLLTTSAVLAVTRNAAA